MSDKGPKWADEMWTVVLALPAVAAFAPGLQDFVSRGFLVIGNAPWWYQSAVGVAIAAAFGRRTLNALLPAVRR